MKKQVIKIEKITPVSFKKVEWRLGNMCNYDCEYCADESKSGDEPYIDIETNKKVVDKVSKLFNGERIQFTFTGGEPTLYPHLYELFKYIKENNSEHQIRMFTNGSRTLRWWTEFMQEPIIDFIMFTYHHTQVKNIDDFVASVNTLNEVDVDGLVFFTCTDLNFDETVQDFEYISDRVGLDCHLKKIHGKVLNQYTEDQNVRFLDNRVKQGRLAKDKSKFSSKFDIYVESHQVDGTVEHIHDPQEIIARDQNRYLFWDCNIGMDRIVIYSDRVYKSICQVGNLLYTVYDDFVPVTEPTRCAFNRCSCGTDILESKVSPVLKRSISLQHQL